MTNISSWIVFIPFGVGMIAGFALGTYWRGLEEKISETEESLNKKIAERIKDWR